MKWNKSELRILRRLYSDTSTVVIAEKLSRSLTAVFQVANRLGLKKSAKYLATEQSGRISKLSTSGAAFRFKAGHNTWNAGKKGWHPGGRAKETQFKKGHVPTNTYRPVGSERLSKDGEPEIKVADPNVWKTRKQVTWEQTYGPVQKGMVLRCRDGNKTNALLSNLELIDRAQNMERNTIHRYPSELVGVMRVAKRLHREIESHEKRD